MQRPAVLHEAHKQLVFAAEAPNDQGGIDVGAFGDRPDGASLVAEFVEEDAGGVKDPAVAVGAFELTGGGRLGTGHHTPSVNAVD